MSDLHNEIIEWRLHMASERSSSEGDEQKSVPSPEATMPYLGEFIGE